ncbi:unnamed protein product [Laminaria digitata]
MTSTPAPSDGGGRNWWRMVFPFKRGSRDQLNGTPRPHAAAAAAPQPRRFEPGLWLRSGWMSTAPIRAKWRWGSLSYIATTWEERPCLTPSDPNAASSPTRAKADLTTGSPRPRCNTSGQEGQEGQEEYITTGASRSPLLRRRVPQGLLIGAIVAAAVYAIYRIRRKPRGPRRRNGRPRRRWWHSTGCGADTGGKYGGGEDGSGGSFGDGMNGDRQEGDGDANPDPSLAPAPASVSAPTPTPCPTPGPELNPELHANPEVREHAVSNGGGPVSKEIVDGDGMRPVVVADGPELSRTREMSFKSDSSTGDLLADVDSLIAATPSEPPGYRKVSGAEVDALVNLTHRVLRREPDALNEIAEDAAYKGVAPTAKGDPLVMGEIADTPSFWMAAPTI